VSLGERIQQLRKARGLSQEQLADSLNVSRQAISKWETDQSSPEIENILALSRMFSISTDELLGNDREGNLGTPATKVRTAKKKPPVFSSIIRDLRPNVDSKFVFLVFTVFCFIAAGTCVIVNLAVNRGITWASYPLLSVAFGWLTITPAIFRKLLVSLGALTITMIPFLYFLERVTPSHDWFLGLGLPIAAVSIIFIWVLYLLFRFTKINLWYKFAIATFLCGVVDNLLISYYVDTFLGTDTSFLQYAISIFSYVVVSALLLILGYMRNTMKAAHNKI
jgi:transcriptional regulator with XRE-family HTH domain